MYTSVDLIATIVYSNEEVNLVDEKAFRWAAKVLLQPPWALLTAFRGFFLVTDFNYLVSENIDLSAYKCKLI